MVMLQMLVYFAVYCIMKYYDYTHLIYDLEYDGERVTVNNA